MNAPQIFVLKTLFIAGTLFVNQLATARSVKRPESIVFKTEVPFQIKNVIQAQKDENSFSLATQPPVLRLPELANNEELYTSIFEALPQDLVQKISLSQENFDQARNFLKDEVLLAVGISAPHEFLTKEQVKAWSEIIPVRNEGLFEITFKVIVRWKFYDAILKSIPDENGGDRGNCASGFSQTLTLVIDTLKSSSHPELNSALQLAEGTKFEGEKTFGPGKEHFSVPDLTRDTKKRYIEQCNQFKVLD